MRRRAQLPQPRRRAGVRRHEHHDRGARPGDRRPARRARARRRAGRRRPRSSTASRHAARVARRLGELRAGAVTRRVHVVVPDGIDDPARPSGGNAYDRRVCDGLAAAGWTVHVHAVPGVVAAARRGGATPRSPRVVARIPDGAVVLVDGLVASTAPEVLVPRGEPAAAGRARAHAARRRRGRRRRPGARRRRALGRRVGRHDQRVGPATPARAVRAAGRPRARRRARRRRRRARAGHRDRPARCSASRR